MERELAEELDLEAISVGESLFESPDPYAPFLIRFVEMDDRVRTVDLRLLSGNTAVHSDMFMWHYDEPVETAALQFLNILFAVPQLSVCREDIPDDHREMGDLLHRLLAAEQGGSAGRRLRSP